MLIAAADDHHAERDVQRAEDGLLQAAAGARGVRGEHAPLEVRHGPRDDAARQPHRRHDDRGQADEAQAQKTALPIFLLTGMCGQAGCVPVAGRTVGPVGVRRWRRYRPGCPGCSWLHSPLPTGSAVPETRRTSNRATTLVASVMIMQDQGQLGVGTARPAGR